MNNVKIIGAMKITWSSIMHEKTEAMLITTYQKANTDLDVYYNDISVSQVNGKDRKINV